MTLRYPLPYHTLHLERQNFLPSVHRLQLGAAESFRQALGSAGPDGTRCARVLVLAGLLLREGLQPVLGQVLTAGAERVVEGGREAGDVSGDVGKNLWRRLVVVTDLGGRRGGSKPLKLDDMKTVSHFIHDPVLPETCCSWSPGW